MSRIAAARSGPVCLNRVPDLAVDCPDPCSRALVRAWQTRHSGSPASIPSRSVLSAHLVGDCRTAFAIRTRLSSPLTEFRHSDALSVLLLRCVKGVPRCVLRVVAARHNLSVAMPGALPRSACCWPSPRARPTSRPRFRRRSAIPHPPTRPRSARRDSPSRTMACRRNRRRCAVRPGPTIRASRGAQTTAPLPRRE